MHLSLSAKQLRNDNFDSKEHTYIRHAERKYRDKVSSINEKLADIASLKDQLRDSTPKQKHVLIAEIEQELKTVLSVFNELRASGQHSDDELDRLERIIRSLANTLHDKKRRMQ